MPKASRKARDSRAKLSRKGVLRALAKVRALILDIDGVLTDARVFYVEGTGWGASYSITDGFGIRLLQRNGLEVCLISGGNFTSHRKRAEVFGIRHAYFGEENKIPAFEKILADLGLREEECAYVGDELFDIPVLRRVGFAATPPHAPAAVKRRVDYVTRLPGGGGAVREICELLLEAKGIDPCP